MFESMFHRKNIKNFFSRYPVETWKELLSNITEIGILNLKISFNKEKFTNEEFNLILNDLKFIIDKNEKNKYNNIYNNNNNKYMNNLNRENKNKKKINDKNIKHYDTNFERKIFSKNSPSNSEVFIADMDEIKRNITKYYPKKKYNPTSSVNEYNNLRYVESKIKGEVDKDKMMYYNNYNSNNNYNSTNNYNNYNNNNNDYQNSDNYNDNINHTNESYNNYQSNDYNNYNYNNNNFQQNNNIQNNNQFQNYQDNNN